MSSYNRYSLCNAICSKETKQKENGRYWRNWVIIFFIMFACITLIVSVSMYIGQNESTWTINDSIMGIVGGSVGLFLLLIGYYNNNKPSKYARFDVDITDIEELKETKNALKEAYIDYERLKAKLTLINGEIYAIKTGKLITKKGQKLFNDITRFRVGSVESVVLKPPKVIPSFDSKLLPLIELPKVRPLREEMPLRGEIQPLKNPDTNIAKSEDELSILTRLQNEVTETETKMKVLKDDNLKNEDRLITLIEVNKTYQMALQIEIDIIDNISKLKENFDIEIATDIRKNYKDITNDLQKINEYTQSAYLNEGEKNKLISISKYYKNMFDNIFDVMPHYLKYKKDIEDTNDSIKNNGEVQLLSNNTNYINDFMIIVLGRYHYYIFVNKYINNLVILNNDSSARTSLSFFINEMQLSNKLLNDHLNYVLNYRKKILEKVNIEELRSDMTMSSELENDIISIKKLIIQITAEKTIVEKLNDANLNNILEKIINEASNKLDLITNKLNRSLDNIIKELSQDAGEIGVKTLSIVNSYFNKKYVNMKDTFERYTSS